MKKSTSNNGIPEDKSPIITLERGACYGSYPIYSLTIYGDGKIVYKGDMFVKVVGKVVTKISKEKVKKLIEAFYKINYFSLKDKYNAHSITDCPSTETSITINGQTKTVYHYHGDFSAPEELTKLEDKIDKIVNSKRWVKLPSK